jgi:hypothetical protein
MGTEAPRRRLNGEALSPPPSAMSARGGAGSVTSRGVVCDLRPCS